jgi:hypothetical protein
MGGSTSAADVPLDGLTFSGAGEEAEAGEAPQQRFSSTTRMVVLSGLGTKADRFVSGSWLEGVTVTGSSSGTAS